MEEYDVLSNINIGKISPVTSPYTLDDRRNPIIEITPCETDVIKPIDDVIEESYSIEMRADHRLESDTSTVIKNYEPFIGLGFSQERTIQTCDLNNAEHNRLDANSVECNVPPTLLKKFSRHKSHHYPSFLNRDKSRTLHRSHSLPDLSSYNADFPGNYRCGCNYHLNRRCIGPQVLYQLTGPSLKLSQQISDTENMSTNSKSTTTSSQAPPHYRSLISSILQDEPPKYQDVTGKTLSRELLQTQRPSTRRNIYRSPTFMNCVTAFAIFFGIIIVISLILYIIDLHFHMFKTVKGPHHRRGRLVSPPFSGDKNDKKI